MRIATMERNDEKLDSVSCDVAGEKSRRVKRPTAWTRVTSTRIWKFSQVPNLEFGKSHVPKHHRKSTSILP